MDWTHVLGIVLGNAAFVIPMFLWNRSESRADYRHMEACTNANFKAIREETQAILKSIQDEMKDFHLRLALQDQEFKMRLCSIEERNKGK